jgi:hypothetical protein
MRCKGNKNELAGTRIAAFAPSRALLPILLLLTGP